MNRIRVFMHTYRKLHIYLVIVILLNAAFYLLKPVKSLMTFISEFTLWIRHALAEVFDPFPFSVAEVLIIIAIIAALFYIIKTIIDAVRSRSRANLIYRQVALALCSIFTVYFLLNIFLGATYYGESFQDKSGIQTKPTSVERLYETTKYFALKVVETSDSVSRNEQGIFNEPLNEIFKRSDDIYDNCYDEFPFMAYNTNKPKKLLFSKILSVFSYTGFYFPFTGEANINIDSPACFIPTTIAHEMAHQRGIAYEQEANFAAIFVSINSGDPIYEYSGYLLAYVYLNNALYKYDNDKYFEVYNLLTVEAKADLKSNNEYWKKYESPVSEVTDAVYDTFLKSYGQELGIQSYGAVADLLIEYYGSHT